MKTIFSFPYSFFFWNISSANVLKPSIKSICEIKMQNTKIWTYTAHQNKKSKGITYVCTERIFASQ